MTTTQSSQNARPNRVAAIVEQDGTRIGHVICKGRTFEAIRKNGTAEDMRRLGRGFRSAEVAAAWVAKSVA